jgi:hypothetical protein
MPIVTLATKSTTQPPIMSSTRSSRVPIKKNNNPYHRSYLFVDGKNKTTYTHRLIVERLLGKKLGWKDIVHHIDENRLNNSPFNLQVVSRKLHIKLHKNHIREGFSVGEMLLNKEKKLYSLRHLKIVEYV